MELTSWLARIGMPRALLIHFLAVVNWQGVRGDGTRWKHRSRQGLSVRESTLRPVSGKVKTENSPRAKWRKHLELR